VNTERQLIVIMGMGLGVGVFVTCVMFTGHWAVSTILGLVTWVAICGAARTVD